MLPWLLRIAANTAKNHRRKLGRYLRAVRRFTLLSSGSTSAEAYDPSPGWEAERLRQALSRLRAADQEVIAMRYFLDLSEEETAVALGVARGTVKSRSYRALARLREVVESEFPELREGREI